MVRLGTPECEDARTQDLKDLFGVYTVFAALVASSILTHAVDTYAIKRRAKSEKSLAAGFRDMKLTLRPTDGKPKKKVPFHTEMRPTDVHVPRAMRLLESAC